MILGSHNSWSYLTPKNKFFKLFPYIGRCQSKDIYTQYQKYNVRCFDLRIKFDNNNTPQIVHNNIIYNIDQETLFQQLEYFNEKGDVYIRLLHDVRRAKDYTSKKVTLFCNYCMNVQKMFPNIKFWGGRNLVNGSIDYYFEEEPVCAEIHASVTNPRYLDDWLPWMYAFFNNKWLKEDYKDIKGILLIDFVNI